jgi:hypothetical protein
MSVIFGIYGSCQQKLKENKAIFSTVEVLIEAILLSLSFSSVRPRNKSAHCNFWAFLTSEVFSEIRFGYNTLPPFCYFLAPKQIQS